jgi:transcription elongation factor GreB
LEATEEIAMGRYRPPQIPGSKYITPQGMQRLSAELDHLWRRKRPHVTRILSEAAAEGDRSENAEYIYRKKQLREIDSRIRHLRKRLENMRVVEELPSDQTRIFFSAWVLLERDDGASICYRVVGPDEFDFDEAYISMDSPMGKALMGKRLDDEIKVQTPKGMQVFLVVDIGYGEKRPEEFL